MGLEEAKTAFYRAGRIARAHGLLRSTMHLPEKDPVQRQLSAAWQKGWDEEHLARSTGTLDLGEWARNNAALIQEDAENLEGMVQRYDGATLDEILRDLHTLAQIALFRAHQDTLLRKQGEREPGV